MMLKVLLKKQLTEAFRSFFYDAKKNKARSKGASAAIIILYAFLIFGVLGGMFTFLSFFLCSPFAEAGLDWLYFFIMSVLAVVFGTLGSVFTTYSGVYLAKDNDLLLSMPIPTGTIVASRLLNVYIIDAMYTLTVILPAIVVHWVVAGFGLAGFFGGIALTVLSTLIVLILSCLLGWCVAKISVRLKNKSIVTVLISLLGIGLYYFIYFQAVNRIGEWIESAIAHGAELKDSAYGVYLFGSIGTGDPLAVLIFSVVVFGIAALTMYLLSRSFLRVTSATSAVSNEKKGPASFGEKTPFFALIGKEIAKFVSSPGYMLNCGLGTFLLPALGVLLLIKGGEVSIVIDTVFGAGRGFYPVFVCAALCLAASMNNMSAPSVSLEGKTLWICRSLPVGTASILRAKAASHLLLTAIPTLFAAVCALIVCPASVSFGESAMICTVPLLYSAFSAVFSTYLGVRFANLNWTNELYAIKQGAAVLITALGGMGVCMAIALLYLLFANPIGGTAYLSIFAVLFGAGAMLTSRLLDTRGVRLLLSL